MNKRFRYSLVAISLLLMITVVRSSIAYFTSKDRHENVFTVGSIAITLSEPSWDESEVHKIIPGSTHAKDPLVTNVGKHDAYVRIRLTVSDYDVIMKHGGSDYDIKSLFHFNDKWVLINTIEEDTTITYIYAYKEKLEVSKETEPLFDTVTIPDFMTKEVVQEMNRDFDIIIKAEGIQAEGFNDYSEAMEALQEQIGG